MGRNLQTPAEKLKEDIAKFCRSPQFLAIICGLAFVGNGFLDHIEEKERKERKVMSDRNLHSPVFTQKKTDPSFVLQLEESQRFFPNPPPKLPEYWKNSVQYDDR